MADVIPFPRPLQGRLLKPWAAKVGLEIAAALDGAVRAGVAGQLPTPQIVADFMRRAAGCHLEPVPAWLARAQRRAALEALIR